MTLNVQLLSDIHFEFHAKGLDFIKRLDPSGVDVLVLAGDISTKPLLISALEAFCRVFPQVAYVYGNHEFYHADPAEVKASVRELEAKTPNLHVLDNQTWTYKDVRFAGTTLWFRKDAKNDPYHYTFTDFFYIKPKGRTSWSWIDEENEKALAFLEKEAGGSDVIVTHHVPSRHCVHPRWAGNDLNRFFVCDLEHLVEDASRPRTWLFGHTHDAWRFVIPKAGAKLYCNPVGYPGEKRQAGYLEKFVFQVGR